MPIESEYQQATVDFQRFMVDAKDTAGLSTTNMAWNMVLGVFYTFRRRLSLAEGIEFAQVLPPVLRAIFVADWDTTAVPVPFGSRESMTSEVKSLRAQHNFSPDSAIASVAAVLRRHVDAQAFARALARMPNEATTYWAVDPAESP